MNYGKYDSICCNRCFYSLICNEFPCFDPVNQLLMITNTINIITILQPLHFNVFLHGYYLQCIYFIRITVALEKQLSSTIEIRSNKTVGVLIKG